jgi:hypothetical protein
VLRPGTVAAWLTASVVLNLVSAAGTAVAADGLRGSAMLQARKIVAGSPTQLTVQVANPGPTEVKDIEILVTPRWSAAIDRAGSIPAGATLTRDVEIRPESIGVFNIRAQVRQAGRPLLSLEAGALEVVEASSRLAPYRDLVPIGASTVVLLGTLLTLWGTFRTQQRVLEETRRQRAKEALAQMILQVSRDYYGTVAGAVSALAEAARRLQSATEEEREHLRVRCFFFYGTLLYKDNEFAFGQSLLFLPDLWAEADLRQLVDDVLDAVTMTRAQEAVVHKCFSDVALMGDRADTPRVTFQVRNLYEFETLLRDRGPYPRRELRQIQDVFDAVKTRFGEEEFVRSILDVERAMKAIMEYEFTTIYSDFYRPPDRPYAGSRDRPADLGDFDAIVGSPSWTETMEILARLDGQRRGRETRLAGTTAAGPDTA